MRSSNNSLSRRDQLAGMAMQAIITQGGNVTHKEIAEYAVKQADLLIKELDKNIGRKL